MYARVASALHAAVPGRGARRSVRVRPAFQRNPSITVDRSNCGRYGGVSRLCSSFVAPVVYRPYTLITIVNDHHVTALATYDALVRMKWHQRSSHMHRMPRLMRGECNRKRCTIGLHQHPQHESPNETPNNSPNESPISPNGRSTHAQWTPTTRMVCSRDVDVSPTPHSHFRQEGQYERRPILTL